jgi:hypothetical protein
MSASWSRGRSSRKTKVNTDMRRSNHRILPTAASFGWTHVAAAADPLRYAHIEQREQQ